MTNSEIFKAAHAEAKLIVAAKHYSYNTAMGFALKRVYNKINKDTYIAAYLAQPKTPKFMWLRGM